MTLTRAIGCISGTSMDGIDVAFVETDGCSIVRPGPGRILPYPDVLRRDLLDLLADPSIAERDPLDHLEARVTDAFADAIAAFMASEKLTAADVDLIGLHGQTVYHRPAKRFTRQLGRGDFLSRALNIAVVDGFRQADVKAGGQGAPLAPVYHQALAAGLDKPLMVLNLGGVANVTYVGHEGELIAFDTGPASALIDDFVRRKLGLPFDAGGQIAARGKADAGVLASLMANPYFARPAPKSLDRQEFHARAGIVNQLADADAVATLTAFTVASIAASLDHVPMRPLRWLVCGGGRHNRAIMAALAAHVGAPVEPVEVVGWDGDQLEAQLFGYLAVRSVAGLPLSYPTTTAVPRPMPAGVLWSKAHSV